MKKIVKVCTEFMLFRSKVIGISINWNIRYLLIEITDSMLIEWIIFLNSICVSVCVSNVVVQFDQRHSNIFWTISFTCRMSPMYIEWCHYWIQFLLSPNTNHMNELKHSIWPQAFVWHNYLHTRHLIIWLETNRIRIIKRTSSKNT